MSCDDEEEAGRGEAQHQPRGMQGWGVGDDCLDYMMLGITRISRYESIELQKNIVIDLNL